MTDTSHRNFFARLGFMLKTVAFLIGTNGLFAGLHAAGLPESGMSYGASALLVRAVAIRSPTLNADSTSWLEGYSLTFSNATMLKWESPIIQYIVYALDAKGHPQVIRGTVPVKEIPLNGDITVITDQFRMQRVIRQNGHDSLPGKLVGVRVRVYSRKNELIEDYTAPWNLMLWQKWDMPPPVAAN